MLVDPITVAASAPTPALTFAVIAFSGEGSNRRDVANNYALDFSHSSDPKKGEKHYMKLSQTVTAVNPLTGGSSMQTATVSLSVSVPAFGWTQTQKEALVSALLNTLADSDVTISKFLAFQS